MDNVLSKDKSHQACWIAFCNIQCRQEVRSGYCFLSSVRPSKQPLVVYLQMDWQDIDTTDKLYSKWKSFWMARLIK